MLPIKLWSPTSINREFIQYKYTHLSMRVRPRGTPIYCAPLPAGSLELQVLSHHPVSAWSMFNQPPRIFVSTTFSSFHLFYCPSPFLPYFLSLLLFSSFRLLPLQRLLLMEVIALALVLASFLLTNCLVEIISPPSCLPPHNPNYFSLMVNHNMKQDLVPFPS